MSDSKIPVASIQLAAHDLREFEARLPNILTQIARAAASGARLVVIPEGSVPAYVIGKERVDANVVSGALARIAELAARYRTTVVCGHAQREGDLTFNAATVFGPDGSVLGRTEKQLLWHFDVRSYARGRDLVPIGSPAGRLGVLICADGRLPTLARTLVERGAEILVVPTAWVTSGRDPDALENVQADVMINVRARENGVPLVAANKVGVERGAVAYCGKSAIVDASGEFLARGNERDETILFADVELGARRFASPPPLATPPATAARRATARIAISAERDPAGLAALASFARFADADALVAPVRPGNVPAGLMIFAVERFDAYIYAGEVLVATVRDATVLDPAGLVEARLAGADIFVWQSALEPRWQLAFARTRAAELRAYVVVLPDAGDRAFAVDPDGTVVCGTYADYRVAAFGYERAKAAVTTVAPHTDVFEGLRAVQALRTHA
ncbi:MAG: carbon-nitrogen hydrolase family protein [Candidatus Baltobacteraceae bacterium]